MLALWRSGGAHVNIEVPREPVHKHDACRRLQIYFCTSQSYRVVARQPAGRCCGVRNRCRHCGHLLDRGQRVIKLLCELLRGLRSRLIDLLRDLLLRLCDLLLRLLADFLLRLSDLLRDLRLRLLLRLGDLLRDLLLRLHCT